MPSIDLFALLGIILVFVLLGVLFFIPTDRTSKKRKRASQPKVPADNKDWQAASLKLEKHIYALRKEIEEFQKAEKLKERDLTRERERIKKLQEKLEQERGWHDKEEKDIERKTQEVHRMRQERVKLEQNSEDEHSLRLKGERELKEITQDFEALGEEKRKVDSELMNLKATWEQGRKETKELKAKNMELAKKHADTTWVAKTEYDKLQQKLKEAEKELERLKK